MQLRLRDICLTLAIAWLLAACSSGGQSLLALEDEKASIREAIAKKIGAPQQEVDQALISSPEQERQTADVTTQKIVNRVGTSQDRAMTAQLQSMANKLASSVGASDKKFHVILLQSNQANAFTPGAGTILVNEGLLQLAENEAQVAAVMSHEMAHVLLGHPQRQKQIRLASKVGAHFMDDYTPTNLVDNVGRWLRVGGNATLNGMIRQQEMMADSIAIDIMAKAGYDPHEMVRLLTKLRVSIPAKDRTTNVVYGNHPLTADREKAAIEKVNRRYREATGIVSTSKYEKLVRPYRE
jgi:predicted Zn-dependent protease